MTARNYSNTASDAELSAMVTSIATSFAVVALTGYPTHPFIAALDPDTTDEEIILVTGVSGTTLTVTRGYDGTTAKVHQAGGVLRHVASAKDFQEANNHVNASSGVHGATGPVVGTTDTQTLTNKTLTAPTISNPTLTGTATGASADFSGSVQGGSLASDSSLTVGTTATIDGALTAASVTTTGAVTAASAAVSGSATVGGTLAVTGTVSGATPTAAGHLARKDYADALGVSAATVSTIVRRDSAGRFAAAAASASGDVVIKSQLDAVSTAYAAADTALDTRLDTLEAIKTIRHVTSAVKIHHGTASADFAAVSFATPGINYAAAGFSAPPLIVATAMAGQTIDLRCSVDTVTSTTAVIVARAPGNITASVALNYIAIGV